MTMRTIADSDARPVRKEFLPFNQLEIDQTEVEEVVDTLRSGCITTCPKTGLFSSVKIAVKIIGFGGKGYANQ